MQVTLAQGVVGAVLVLRLLEFWISRRNAENRLAAGESEAAGELHLWFAMFHAGWLAALALLTEGAVAFDPIWLGAGVLLVVLRAAWLIRARGHWTARLFASRQRPLAADRPQRLLRGRAYLPMLAELLVVPLIFGLWWFALAGTAVYAALAWMRLVAEETA